MRRTNVLESLSTVEKIIFNFREPHGIFNPSKQNMAQMPCNHTQKVAVSELRVLNVNATVDCA